MKDSLKNKNNCIIIPCYNEVTTLRKVVEISLQTGADVIVVDDGSTDGSIASLKGLNNIILLSNKGNLGKGKALDNGLRYAILAGYNNCVTLDADLQHPPELASNFFSQLEMFSMVIGTRGRSGSAMPIQRKVSNFLTTVILQLKTGINFKDSQCGYRGYKLNAIADILPDMSGFMAETEILINAAKKGIKPGFVEIPVIYGDTDSKMKPWESILGFIKLILSK
ncbi:MAG: glycosyltransferase family 2 protein [Ignavibacteriales bacterium]|nr:glycosyltransferase family 2 protein [Ignavibacteriales bacterium]